jgi:mitochondrial import receptor subunit TOM40
MREGFKCIPTFFLFSGMVDTNGFVTAVIEKRLAPLPFTFMLSSSLNHAKAAYRFGIGLLIG